MDITKSERRIYVLKDKEDFLILSKIKELEKKGLNKGDKVMVNLIRTQLKKD